MKFRTMIRPKSFHLAPQATTHWRNSEEMHKILHLFPGYFKALLLELSDKPMSREDIQKALRLLEIRMVAHHKREKAKIHLEKDIAIAVERKVLEEKAGKFVLTPGGREMVEHMQTAIPFFFETLYSTKMVAIVTILVHVLLSALKLVFGMLSNSAGLIADGIDNTADTLSSVLVWLGIKFDKEKPASLFIVAMMFVSVGGVGIAAYHKIVYPEPVQEGMTAVVVSFVSGLMMLVISAYQYMVGKRQSNFAILCQAVDSRNHFLTSLLVCGGIILSFLADNLQVGWSHCLYYADAVASIIIGLLILQGAVELSKELLKPGDEPSDISHFMRSAQEKVRQKIMFEWLSQQLRDVPLSREQLEERFTRQFCQQTPKILELSKLGYRPQSSMELLQDLEHFVTDRKLVFREGKYTLKAIGKPPAIPGFK